MRKPTGSRTDIPEQLSFSELLVGVSETQASVPPEDGRSIAVTSKIDAPRVHSDGHAASRRRPHGSVLYPHLFAEGSGSSAVALKLLSQAMADADSAAEAYSSGDLLAVSARLGQIAAAASAAHAKTEFNEALGMVVSHIRRAVLKADATSVNLDQLHTLSRTLRMLFETPTIPLDNAGQLIDELDAVGWDGDHSEVETLVAALLSSDANQSEASVSPAPAAEPQS